MKPFSINPDITKAVTPPNYFYTSNESYQLCLDRCFATSWQFIGDTSAVKVPGQVAPVILLEGSLDEPLVLTRDSNDEVHCLSNVCTHRGNIVCEGASIERFLRCRYHGRRFGLDGKFQFMPEFDGVEGFPSEKDNLSNIAFGKWGNLLFASLNPLQPIDDFLSPMQKRLDWLPLDEFVYRPERSKDYLIKAHWALYCDNYLEGFHIPFIHADLAAKLDYSNYSTELFPFANLQLGVANEGEDCFELPQSSPDFRSKIAAYYFWLFPNMMFNFYPWGLSINVVKPLAPSLTRVSFYCFVWKEDRMGAGAGAGIDRVEREDEAVVEMVQRGIRSRIYDGGRYAPIREIGTHHFHQLLAGLLFQA